MPRNSAVNLDVRNHVAGFSLESTSGHRFELADYDIKLIGQQNTELTMPNVAATELLAKSHFGAAGDLIYGTGANQTAILAKGAAGQVLTATATGIAWSNPAESPAQEVTDATTVATSMVYVTNSNTTRVVMTLPATADFGETFKIANRGTAGFRIAQAAGQRIRMLDASSTLGAGGYAQSTSQYDALEVMSLGGGEFMVINALGNLEFA